MSHSEVISPSPGYRHAGSFSERGREFDLYVGVDFEKDDLGLEVPLGLHGVGALIIRHISLASALADDGILEQVIDEVLSSACATAAVRGASNDAREPVDHFGQQDAMSDTDFVAAV